MLLPESSHQKLSSRSPPRQRSFRRRHFHSLTFFKLLFTYNPMSQIIGHPSRNTKVFSQLSQLPDQYIVSPNYKTPFSPPTLINYLVIGPTGLHPIFTKHHAIKYLEQARHDLRKAIDRAIISQRPDDPPYTARGQRSSRKLPWFDHHWSASSIHIEIILCLTGDATPTPSDAITILSTPQLIHYIQSQTSSLDSNQVTALGKYLRL